MGGNRPGLHQAAARIIVAKEHIGQGSSGLLAAMGHVHNGRDVLFCPIDGERKTAYQHNYRIGIGFIHPPDQFLLLQQDDLAVNSFLTVAGDRAQCPTIVAGGVIANNNNGNI